jgi:trehalose/maltose hydrolase-like predicted phosphorylase
MLGVTGPNNYEPRVNNGTPALHIRRLDARYTLQAIDHITGQQKDLRAFATVSVGNSEPAAWQTIVDRCFPYDASATCVLAATGWVSG